MTRRHSYSAAFTLIEISMVLVIIGLLIAGILVGRDMITSAKMRKTITDKEMFDAAVETFVMKYGFLPGDLRDTSLLPGAASRTYASAHGDGDGYLSNGIGGTNQCLEVLLFWADLSVAGLINKASNVAQDGTTSTCVPNTINWNDDIPKYLPQAEWGGKSFWWIGIVSGTSLHAYNLTYVDSIGTNGAITTVDNRSFGPLPNVVAYNIDQKIDDGQPSNGRMTTYSFGSGTKFSDDWGCRSSNTQYNLTGTTGCSVEIKVNWGVR